MAAEGGILVVNAGSSSIKLKLFGADLAERLSGSATEIGGEGRLSLGATDRAASLPDHRAALAALIEAMAAEGVSVSTLTAAGHRVVHGGETLTKTVRVTPSVETAIEAAAPLAPLHNPHNLSAIRALAALAPGLAQFATFDTAFHATNPEVARRYALPETPETAGIRRYGFHGTSYRSLVDRWSALTGTALPRRLLALHLGNGASLCAIEEGRSVATTMGYSPLEGLTMGTRVGTIDANAVLDLAERHGIDRTRRLLNHESGLLGLGGASDMRALSAADNDEARFAQSHFAYWAVRHAGSMIAAMGGLDAVAFTGGIGENDAWIRHRILQGLAPFGVTFNEQANRASETRLDAPGSAVMVAIVPAAEEAQIAREALALMEPVR
ncbi:MAG: acetate/propionate family kinase [Pseudomonadota bacterium]